MFKSVSKSSTLFIFMILCGFACQSTSSRMSEQTDQMMTEQTDQMTTEQTDQMPTSNNLDQGNEQEPADQSTNDDVEIRAYRDLEYTTPPNVESDLAQLDIFRSDDDEVRPLVLLVHGGSWASGDKAGFEDKIVPWWIEQGYVAAPVNFRLASRMRQTPVVKPADQVRDIAAALAWVMDHAEEYKIARDGVVLLGYSSGAHLVALLGTDESFVRAVGLEETQITASISFDVHAYDVPYALELMEGSVVEQNIPIIRHLFGESEEEQLSSSPISFVDGWAAKALIISVDEDPEEEGTHGYIVSKTAEHYVNALTAAGHSADTFHDPSETHSSLVGGFGEAGDAVTEKVKAFLETLP